MSKTFDQGRDEVARLCKQFETNRAQFLAPTFKEAHVRQSLIDPLFEALGWDVHNTQGVAPQYREVVPEDSLDIEGHQKAPDYAFRVGTLAKFYAEAKKCGININADPGPAYQLRRYGWSAKVALSLLTDFEELGIYDCTLRPRQSDKASRARILYFLYNEYPDRWREIWDVFSHEAVWAGSFDQYAASKRKRGTSEVDAEFLREIEGWRDELARNLALRNLDLSPEDLNEAVQRIIDRIVFLRMAEDRGIEPYGQLLKLCERPGIYARFMSDLCRKADLKYNSGLFHFQKETSVSEPPDRLTPKLAVDDKVLKKILQDLYFENGCPYHFGVLPVAILGTVYERFLGKVIRLTAGHHAKVEEKPEVRKAGGVYYTPAYIVDYIVKQTVGQKIEGKSPAQLAGAGGKPPFRVLDMACGSGSFLLGAYQCLLDHGLKWYIEHNPETRKTAVRQDPRDQQWRLTIEEKKRILTTHLFGVDIDRQAVEVTKLSLMLKALEGEDDISLTRNLELFQSRALPNLADNILCGNSLIGPDYFIGSLTFDPEEMRRVNPFDWHAAFPQAMQAGGFDCVIGNPPYGGVLTAADKNYFKTNYVCQNYQLDSYLLFLEAALRRTLLTDGLFGMIIPNPWLTNIQQTRARRFVLNNTCVVNIVHFLFPVFPQATVDTEIVILRKCDPKGCKPIVTLANDVESLSDHTIRSGRQIQHQQDKWRELDGGIVNVFLTPDEEELADKCKQQSRPLEDFCKINVGIKPYQTGKGTPPQTSLTVANRPFDSDEATTEDHRPYLRGRDINRYIIAPLKPRFIKYGPWLAEPRPAAGFDAPLKLLMRQTGDSLVAAIDEKKYLCLNNMHVIVPLQGKPSPKYLLGVINSRLLNWFYQTMNPERGEALAEVKKTNVASLPIRLIDYTQTKDTMAHDRMVLLVDSMLALHKQLAVAEAVSHKEIIQRQIAATDAEIDRLAYDLYGLTPDEIAIVEGKS